jgi:uncharacterized membrane protein HdeD (DUF308 family)
MKAVANAMIEYWWPVVFRGAPAVVFGAAASVWPGITIYAFVYLFVANAIVSGVLSIATAAEQRSGGISFWSFIRRNKSASSGQFIFQSILGVGLGLAVITWPGSPALALIYVIAASAFVAGIFEVVTAIDSRKVIDNEWLLALAGIASIAYGVFAALFPGDGAVSMVWTIGIYAVVFGTLLIFLGFRFHGMNRQLARETA